MRAKKRTSSASESHRYILKKLEGKRLSDSEIGSIIGSINRDELSDEEIAYYVAAVDKRGMDLKETTALTRAMVRSGDVIKWPFRIVADKHCVGGIPGNRTTPIVVAICAAAGLHIPKTSSRSITSAAGTADVMEIITDVSLTPKKLRAAVMKTNACLAWCGILGLNPVDEKLIRLERKMNTNPGPQIVASILSKKIAAGSTHILIDIPVGDGAKFSAEGGRKIALFFRKVAAEFNLKLDIIFTDGSQPIGNGVGPVLEMNDVLAVLSRSRQVADLEEKSILLSGKMLELAGKCKKGEGNRIAKGILDSGNAWKKFNDIVQAQGRVGNPVLVPGKSRFVVSAPRDCVIRKWRNQHVNALAKALGCPDHKRAGIYIHAHAGARLKRGQPICTLYAESQKKLSSGISFLNSNSIFQLK